MPTLDWEGKAEALEAARAVPYRLLVEEAALGYGDAQAGNAIIQGDNLAALKALLPYYKERVKCIYADPPYNTGSAFEHYEDNLEHSTWLSLMYPRLELMRELLSEDGSIWISIDDTEGHYLKVICDEVFGRENFIATIVWQRRTTRENRRVFSFSHDYILVYARKKEAFENSRNLMPLTDDVLSRYKNPDNDPRGPWQSVSANAQAGHATANQFYKLKLPSGREILPPAGRCWLYTKPKMLQEIAKGNIYFGSNGNNAPRIKKFLNDGSKKGLTPETLWTASFAGTNDSAKKEILALFGKQPFITPKPESLLRHIIHIATNANDLVLDAFLGSGTTAAVAQKMGRRYLGIEMGEHAVTHVVPRLRKVIDGEQGGISEAVHWQGGGGFRFFRLGETVFDEFQCIRPEVSFRALAAHIYFTETRTSYTGQGESPLLGVYDGTAYYLLYNGILGDRRPQGGNVLTSRVLALLPPFDGPKVIYGEACRFRPLRLQKEQITFKQIPTRILMD